MRHPPRATTVSMLRPVQSGCGRSQNPPRAARPPGCSSVVFWSPLVRSVCGATPSGGQAEDCETKPPPQHNSRWSRSVTRAAERRSAVPAPAPRDPDQPPTPGRRRGRALRSLGALSAVGSRLRRRGHRRAVGMSPTAGSGPRRAVSPVLVFGLAAGMRTVVRTVDAVSDGGRRVRSRARTREVEPVRAGPVVRGLERDAMLACGAAGRWPRRRRPPEPRAESPGGGLLAAMATGRSGRRRTRR